VQSTLETERLNREATAARRVQDRQEGAAATPDLLASPVSLRDPAVELVATTRYPAETNGLVLRKAAFGCER
jgi:hypothetical protein